MSDAMGAGYSRLEGLVRIGVWLLIRQSSRQQRERNKGSAVVQREQARYVAPFGVAPADIEVVDARGESGRRDADRKRFRDLLEAAQSGRVGVLLLARHDRLGRNSEDSAALFDALRRARSLIMVDGRCFDPCEAEDDMLLKLQAAFAEYENAARTRWLQLTRWALARRGAFRSPLPSGLVWASPRDPAYRKRLRAEGLDGWIERLKDDPKQYKVRANFSGELPGGPASGGLRGRRYYPLPFPDRDVVRAAELRVRWLLETRSLTAVLARIGARPADGVGAGDATAAHPDWPVPGCVPVIKTGGAVWHPDMQVEWRPVERTALKAWYRSPAVYGIYAVSSRVIDPDGDQNAPGRGAGRKADPLPDPSGDVDADHDVADEGAWTHDVDEGRGRGRGPTTGRAARRSPVRGAA